MRFAGIPRETKKACTARGAAGAERNVVFTRAALVGMALDDEGILRISLQPLDLAVERADGFLGEVGGIGQEEDAVADIDGEILRAAGRRRAAGYRQIGAAIGPRLGAGREAKSHARDKGQARNRHHFRHRINSPSTMARLLAGAWLSGSSGTWLRKTKTVRP